MSESADLPPPDGASTESEAPREPSSPAPSEALEAAQGTDAGSPRGTDAAWARAEGHALAAASLLDDPSVPPWTAAGHLRRGFRALAAAAGLEPPSSVAQLDLSSLPWVGSPQTAQEALGALAQDDATIESDALRRLSAALSGAVRTAQDERFAPQHRRERRRLWLRRLGMLLLVLAPVIAFLALTLPDYREGPWRAALYSTKDFEGEPLVRRDGDLKFDWKRRSPHPDLPEDGFSARWDTCMVLDEDLEVAFQLISDDGSRMFLDGEQIIDNWGRHGERSRGAEVPVSAGVHHLRVDYFDERHAATVKLQASFYGEPPDSLPVRILRYPGDELHEDDPCGAVR